MKKLIPFIIIISLTILGFWAYPQYKLHFSEVIIHTNDVDVYIPTGFELEDVGNVLVEENIYSDTDEFNTFCLAFGYNKSNVTSGKYNFKNGQKLKHVMYALKNGNQEQKNIKVVFTYSQNIPSMVSKVCHSIEADSADLVDYILSDSVIKKYGFNTKTIMSMFLPDTYEVGEWDMTPQKFVSFMAKQYRVFWNTERISKAKALNLSQSEVSTLASIVMSEQSLIESEWPIISGLYINRLSQGIKLESDPTFKFCWGDELKGVQRLLFKHRDKDCPYNTYIYKGLPPGPIMLVSKKAIDAVLNYQKHNYIFMCAIGDGSSKHNFAKSYVEHLRNAAIYKRNQFGSN